MNVHKLVDVSHSVFKPNMYLRVLINRNHLFLRQALIFFTERLPHDYGKMLVSAIISS